MIKNRFSYLVVFFILVLPSLTIVNAVEIDVFIDNIEASSVTSDSVGEWPVLKSQWAEKTPVIDGVYAQSEWGEPQLHITSPIPTYVYFKNDLDFLYVCVDAANGVGGDYTEEDQDHCTLAFYNPEKGVILIIQISGPVGVMAFSDSQAAIGFGQSPNSPIAHKIYEFKLPLIMDDFEWASACITLRFASPHVNDRSLPYDWNGGSPRYNIWPPTAVYEDVSTYGLLKLACPFVGGEVQPQNVATISWWLMALSIITLSTGIVLNKKKLI